MMSTRIVTVAACHDGMPVFDATNSNIAVFVIDPATGEPKLIQLPIPMAPSREPFRSM
jgi:hypothetical protein